jgi:L-threonine kinase
VALQANHLLYRDFPIGISRPYKDLTLAPDWGTKHMGLLGLAEAALTYLASLCLSDYRTRTDAPARKVEVMLERSRSKKLTLGFELALFRESVQAVEEPLIPPPDRFPKCQLDAVGRFGAAFEAIQAAVDGLSADASPAAIDVGVHVRRGLSSGSASLGWWQGWEKLVAYRNKVAHFDSERWPIYSAGYWDLMGPLLHDCLVELLTQEQIADAILGHPVFQIMQIHADGSGNVVHSLCGEERGVYFERDVIDKESVTERWGKDHWKATDASLYVLERADSDSWVIRGPFWDLHNGVPPVMDLGMADSITITGTDEKPTSPARRSAVREGRGTAPGTCGEFAQGVLSCGTPFHATCPINKSATVAVSLRPARALKMLGLGEHHRKLELAIQHAIDLLDVGPVEVTVRHWSDLHVGKGMGSSTADVLAGLRAIADAVGQELDAETEGKLAAKVESSDGSMYPGIAAVNHKTCELVKAWEWYPEFVIVMLIPSNSVDTASIPFAGQERLAAEYDDLLARMDGAIERRSIEDFAVQSTRSAALNDEFLLNPYSRNLSGRLEGFNALGLNVGHTGTVCGLLFANTEEGRASASEACPEVRRQFPDLKDVTVVTTPYCTNRAD